MSGRPSSATAARASRRDSAGARRSRSRPDGQRVRRLRSSHSYGLVLTFVIVVFFFTAIAPDDNWAGSAIVLLLGSTLVCGLWTSGAVRPGSRVNIALVTITAIVACVNLLPGREVRGAVGISEALLTVATGLVIARGVIDQGEVNFQSVRGAIAIYLLLGLLFTFLYGAIANWGPVLFSQGTDGTRAVRLYFSYVTLTTLGYGDYAPAGTAAHTLAIVEALLGQLYLVTIVALLVSRLHTGPSED